MLVIHHTVKKVIASRVKMAVAKLEKSDFDAMMGLATRLLLFSEAFPNPDWDKEFLLASFVIGGTASHADSEFKELVPENKTKVLENYSELLVSFGKAIESEDVKLVNDVLKKMLVKFYEVFGP